MMEALLAAGLMATNMWAAGNVWYLNGAVGLVKAATDAKRSVHDHSTPVLRPIKPGDRLDSLDCVDAPSIDEILSALPDSHRRRGYAKIVIEKLVDQIDYPRFYPLVGPAHLHRCHWKCTVYFIEGKKRRAEVVYIDKDHLHSVATEQDD